MQSQIVLFLVEKGRASEAEIVNHIIDLCILRNVEDVEFNSVRKSLDYLVSEGVIKVDDTATDTYYEVVL
jgi:hypothetical protein